MSQGNKPSSAGENSRPQGKLQLERIIEFTAETGVCEKCKRAAIFCFTMEGFPNSKLCRPCGIYYKKYPATFISKDVWTEPRHYGGWKYFFFVLFFIWSQIVQILMFRHLHESILIPILGFFAFMFGLLTCHINHYRVEPHDGTLHKMVEYFVTKVEVNFGCLVRWLNLTEIDYLEDTVHVIHQRMNRQLIARENEVAKLKDELDCMKKQMADLQCSSQQKVCSCDDRFSDITPQRETLSESSTEDSTFDERDFAIVHRVPGKVPSTI